MMLRHDMRHFPQSPHSFPQQQHKRPPAGTPVSRDADPRRGTGDGMRGTKKDASGNWRREGAMNILLFIAAGCLGWFFDDLVLWVERKCRVKSAPDHEEGQSGDKT